MFSDLLKDRIRSFDYTYYFVAWKVGVSEHTIYKWTSGLSLPRLEYYFKLCDVLQVEYDYFSASILEPGVEKMQRKLKSESCDIQISLQDLRVTA